MMPDTMLTGKINSEAQICLRNVYRNGLRNIMIAFYSFTE